MTTSWFLSIRASLTSDQIIDILRSADFAGFDLHPRNNFLANVATLNNLMIGCDFVGPVSYEHIKEFIIEWINSPDSDPYSLCFVSDDDDEVYENWY